MGPRQSHSGLPSSGASGWASPILAAVRRTFISFGPPSGPPMSLRFILSLCRSLRMSSRLLDGSVVRVIANAFDWNARWRGLFTRESEGRHYALAGMR
jgi:hypothetical protein